MVRKRPRKPRGSRGSRDLIGANESLFSGGAAYDLMVPLPKNVSGLKAQLQIKDIMNRLASTGFTHMALTHTIYGRPKPTEDKAEVAIPESLWLGSKLSDKEPFTKKQKLMSDAATVSTNNKPPIRILRRLHVVLENLSDVGLYLSKGPHEALLNGYDIVSVSPRNDATFQSACVSATVADIITLDYTTRGIRLPFKIRSNDVKAVMDRQAAFEFTYSPALLQEKQRKSLVQGCRELQTSSLGLKPRIIFSSGDRTFEDSDVGPMAFRMPGDLSNLLSTVFHFDPATSSKAVGVYCRAVLKRAEERRYGKSDIGEVTIARKGEEIFKKEMEKLESTATTSKDPPNTAAEDRNNDDDSEGVEDGFISMS